MINEYLSLVTKQLLRCLSKSTRLRLFSLKILLEFLSITILWLFNHVKVIHYTNNIIFMEHFHYRIDKSLFTFSLLLIMGYSKPKSSLFIWFTICSIDNPIWNSPLDSFMIQIQLRSEQPWWPILTPSDHWLWNLFNDFFLFFKTLTMALLNVSYFTCCLGFGNNLMMICFKINALIFTKIEPFYLTSMCHVKHLCSLFCNAIVISLCSLIVFKVSCFD
jgi:hypothetical protein